MNSMSEETVRVDFNAPVSLVEQADSVADLLGISRTQLLIEALRDELEELASDETVEHELRAAYYHGRVEFDVVESVLGTEDAMRLKLLRESIDREPPEPELDDGLPADEAFYDGDVPEWTPDEDADHAGSSP